MGGLSILKALCAELPFEDFVYVSDSGFAPYGERDEDFVVARSRTITDHLLYKLPQPIKALVIACNTATAAAIHLLRHDYPHLPIIGVEPALKPAVTISQTHRIGVMATRGTLNSRKFKALLESLAGKAHFVCQPCDGLADAIERNDTTTTIALCAKYTGAIGQFGIHSGQIDCLVLGCTHYPFASDYLTHLLGPNVHLISNGEPVARQTRRVLKDLADTTGTGTGNITLLTTGNCNQLTLAAQRWLTIERAATHLTECC